MCVSFFIGGLPHPLHVVPSDSVPGFVITLIDTYHASSFILVMFTVQMDCLLSLRNLRDALVPIPREVQKACCCRQHRKPEIRETLCSLLADDTGDEPRVHQQCGSFDLQGDADIGYEMPSDFDGEPYHGHGQGDDHLPTRFATHLRICKSYEIFPSSETSHILGCIMFWSS